MGGKAEEQERNNIKLLTALEWPTCYNKQNVFFSMNNLPENISILIQKEWSPLNN